MPALQRETGLGEHRAVAAQRRRARALDLLAVDQEVGCQLAERRVRQLAAVLLGRQLQLDAHHEAMRVDRREPTVEVTLRHPAGSLNPLARAAALEPRRTNPSLDLHVATTWYRVPPLRHPLRRARRPRLHDQVERRSRRIERNGHGGLTRQTASLPDGQANLRARPRAATRGRNQDDPTSSAAAWVPPRVPNTPETP